MVFSQREEAQAHTCNETIRVSERITYQVQIEINVNKFSIQQF